MGGYVAQLLASDLVFLIGVLSAATIICYQAYYQLWLSPLAKFPGPLFASVSRYYELYYDGLKSHGYGEKIRALHKLYGPIVRISPYEIHINDPDFYVELNLGRELDKYAWYYNVGDALVTTSGYKEHKEQRKVLSHFFRPGSIDNGEIFKTIDRLRANFQKTLRPTINLSNAYRSLSNDIVTNFYFSSSNKLIDEADFASEFHQSCGGFLRLLAFIRLFPFVGQVLTSLSMWYGILFKPSDRLKSMLHYQQNIGLRINKAITSPNNDGSTGGKGVLQDILNSTLGAELKSPRRLHTEVLGAIIAGTEGTANVLITATFYLLSNPECYQKLQAELRRGWPRSGTPSFEQLLEFPYLGYVILESYRLERGSVFRKPVVSSTPLTFKEWSIPAGTAISMTPKLIHENEDIFPDPFMFNPERWKNDEVHLKKYLGTFSKGGRDCLGKHIAQRVIYYTIASIFYHFDLSFEEIDDEQGLNNGLLDLFPERCAKGLTVIMTQGPAT